MADRNQAFLGIGWSFPPSFSPSGRELEMVSGSDNVHKSVEIILKTSLGERPMQEDFGGSLSPFLFEPLSTQLIKDIRETVRKAILLNEPRVILEEVEIIDSNAKEGLVVVQIQYTIQATNTRFNFVYPFYLLEAEGQL